jgi:hypothetical protein
MRIIGGKYLNWGSEAYQTGHGNEDGDGQGEGWRYDTTWTMYPAFGDADN